jgi:hypothetical protein
MPYEISTSSFFKIQNFIPFIPSIPSVLEVSQLSFQKGFGLPSYVVAAREKNLSP